MLSEKYRGSCASIFGNSFGKKSESFRHLEFRTALASSHWLACIKYLFWTVWQGWRKCATIRD